MTDQDGGTFYTEWQVDPYSRKVYPSKQDVRLVSDILNDPRLELDLFNLKFDFRMLGKVGVKLPTPQEIAKRCHEVMIMARVCNTNEITYALKPLAWKYAGIPYQDEKTLQDRVVRDRNMAKKLGWKVATEEEHGKQFTKADYWIPRRLDPNSRECEDYGRRDGLRTLVMRRLYSTVAMLEQPEFVQTYETERQLLPIVMAMETRGVSLDLKQTREELKHYRERQRFHYEKMQAILVLDRKVWWGKNYVAFNPNSDQQIRRILFDQAPVGYGFKPTAWTKPDNPQSVPQPSIGWEDICCYDAEPFVRHLLLWRTANKAEVSFFGKFAFFAVPDPLNAEPDSYALHPTAHQNGARTLRFSQSDPTLQNIQNPKTAARSYSPIQVRHVIKPRKGYRWYKFDYSQQEIRIFAEIAQSKPMLDSIYAGEDINNANANRLWGNRSENGGNNVFAKTACAMALELNSGEPSKAALEAWKVLGWNPSLAKGGLSAEALEAAAIWLGKYEWDIVKAEWAIQVAGSGEGKKNSRTRAKNCFYAKIYGSGVEGVRTMLYCTAEEARQTLNRFDMVFPEIRACGDSLIDYGRTHGYVRTLYGDVLKVDPGFEYKGINYAVQGTAAAMMKDSMIRVSNYIERSKLDAHIVLTVHDELDFEIRKEHCYLWFLRGIRTIMQDTGGRLKVPMIVEVERITESWDKGVKIEL
jgi:DNA polymerase I-like protein with 3'-5' exonuclease and polymerase domains